MPRFGMGLAVVAITLTALAVPGAFTAGGGVEVANAAPIPGGSIQVACPAGILNGTTYTLTADCGEVTSPITVPPTITTVDGGGHIISATDLANPADPTDHTIPQWNGGIVTNAGAGQTMNIKNVTITGPAAGFSLCNNSGNVLYGIFFNGAGGGSVTNVTVDHIFQFQNGAFGSCQTGRAIRADNSGTITITGTTVRDYQKSGFEARGSTIMNLSGSTAGPSHALEGLIAQNGVSIVGAAGTVENNTIFGSGYTQSVGGPGASTAVLLFGAHDVTVTNNTLTSPAAPRPGTDVGISVVVRSTGIVISFNRVNRLGPDAPDDVGLGIDVFTPDGSTATLICNTFSQWKINVVGAEQIACTPLPSGTVCRAYSAPAPVVDSGKNYGQTPLRFTDPDVLPLADPVIVDATPFIWTVDSGSLPPGLSLSSAGAITGTPTTAGTSNFTLKVVDSTGLTATQAQTITIAPQNCTPPPTTPTTPTPPPTTTTTPTPPPPAKSTVQVVKTWVGTPSTTTIFVDADGQAPYDASVVADTNGASTSFAYPVGTSVTVGETGIPSGFTATIDCGQGAQTYTAPITVNAPATAGATLACRIVNTANPAPPAQRPTLVIEKVASKHTVRAGNTIQFTITIRTRGQGTATNVLVCDVLPPGLVFVRAPGATFSGGRTCWRIASISAGRSRSYHVTVRANSVQRATLRMNIATVVSPGTDCTARRVRRRAIHWEVLAASLARCSATARVLVRPLAGGRAGGVTG
jgi:uncharacterized repeat protein (TIGR01451 family)